MYIGLICDSAVAEDDYDGDYGAYDNYDHEEEEGKKSENLKTDIRDFFGVSQSRKFRSSKKGKDGMNNLKLWLLKIIHNIEEKNIQTFLIASLLTKHDGEEPLMKACDSKSMQKFKESHETSSNITDSNCDIRLPDYKNDKYVLLYGDRHMWLFMLSIL